MPLEWRGGVLANAPASLAMTASVKADTMLSQTTDIGLTVDYRIGSAWSAIPQTMMIAFAEWGHLLLQKNRDDTMAMEILATVKADINVPSNRRVGQKSIGSQLEPDEWEEENEPC
jgi:hypothetical protein